MKATILFVALLLSACEHVDRKYVGQVRRAGDGRVMGGVTVEAREAPAPSIMFLVPQTYRILGRQVTDREGKFEFIAKAPGRRISLVALGRDTVVSEGGSRTRAIPGSVAIENPSADRINILEVPTNFDRRHRPLLDPAIFR